MSGDLSVTLSDIEPSGNLSDVGTTDPKTFEV